MDGIISTKPDLCRRCYGCIRECPAKAIRVVNGQALIMQERCIVCGHCVKVCSQNAKYVECDSYEDFTRRYSGKGTVAIVAPSFAASWGELFRKVPTALRKLGFEFVMETAFGADLISPLYVEELEQNKNRTIISSSCPAVCTYVEKYFPELVSSLAPIVSPMAAMGKYIKNVHGAESKVVFFGPCTAKKAEILDGETKGIIDDAYTFVELKEFFESAGIRLEEIEDSHFDPPHANMGKVYPLAGGLLKTANLPADVLEKEIIVVEGKGKVLEIIEEIANNKINAKFVDILFCEGCINGPGIASNLNYYSRREKVIEYVHDTIKLVDKQVWKSNVYNSRGLDLNRAFKPREVRQSEITEENLRDVFHSINKRNADDMLNCSACGYSTCREFAVSVAKGLAEKEMCLPYLIDELQNAYDNLHSTQEQLHSAEKLASIGQLAAGIAHEINNPLGTIMLYASLAKKQLARLVQNADTEDIETIINEANRCKNIVANLLNFARQGKLSLTEFDVFDLISHIIKKLRQQPVFNGIKVELSHEADNSVIEADKDQVEQVLLNLLTNAAEAMENSDVKTISIGLREASEMVTVTIRDTGCGIPKENFNRIFTPFFTTKKIGKGTGLGMAIAYGIIKMHKGDIRFESECNHGTTFSLSLQKKLSPVSCIIN